MDLYIHMYLSIYVHNVQYCTNMWGFTELNHCRGRIESKLGNGSKLRIIIIIIINKLYTFLPLNEVFLDKYIRSTVVAPNMSF